MSMYEMVWIDGTEIFPGPWRATYLLKPDMEVLARSMADYGWLQPIVVQRSTNRIIDGHIRWEIAGSVKSVQKAHKGMVPVIYKDCSDTEAKLMHLRLNRSKGSTVAKKMSRLVRDIVFSGAYKEKDIKKMLAMSSDEVDIMMDGTLIKSRKIAEHKYSRAWVPVEAPASATESSAVIERPPNPDR
jgi:ParB-like chromosome segregation protein Spo0J